MSIISLESANKRDIYANVINTKDIETETINESPYPPPLPGYSFPGADGTLIEVVGGGLAGLAPGNEQDYLQIIMGLPTYTSAPPVGVPDPLVLNNITNYVNKLNVTDSSDNVLLNVDTVNDLVQVGDLLVNSNMISDTPNLGGITISSAKVSGVGLNLVSNSGASVLVESNTEIDLNAYGEGSNVNLTSNAGNINLVGSSSSSEVNITGNSSGVGINLNTPNGAITATALYQFITTTGSSYIVTSQLDMGLQSNILMVLNTTGTNAPITLRTADGNINLQPVGILNLVPTTSINLMNALTFNNNSLVDTNSSGLTIDMQGNLILRSEGGDATLRSLGGGGQAYIQSDTGDASVTSLVGNVNVIFPSGIFNLNNELAYSGQTFSDTNSLGIGLNATGPIAISSANQLSLETGTLIVDIPSASTSNAFLMSDGTGTGLSTFEQVDATMASYTPSDPSYWVSAAPTTIQEALDRIANVISNGGLTPIP
jgi:hypothetical protein